MSDAVDDDLYERTKAFLEPGDIDLMGAIVHTALTSADELELHELQVELNDIVAAHADTGEAYIYAGNDDTGFASNQYQGLTLDGDEFVWEAQHLLRAGTFDVVIYYEASADQEAIVEDVEALEDVRAVTSVVLDEA
jgi:hypothetical protein